MKAKDIRDMTTPEIEQRIRDERDEIQQLRFQHAIADLENAIVLKHKRRTVARLKTILHQRELQESQ